MSIQPESEHVSVFTKHFNPISTSNRPVESVDVNVWSTFRSYLKDAPVSEHALPLVIVAIEEITEHNDELSNDQIFDHLSSTFCGPELMERESLLAFMGVVTTAIHSCVATRARLALQIDKAFQPSGETAPSVRLAQLSLVKSFPQEVLRFSRAIQQVAINNQMCGSILQLAEFIGCTDLEISQLLEIAPEAIKALHATAITDTWNAYTSQSGRGVGFDQEVVTQNHVVIAESSARQTDRKLRPLSDTTPIASSLVNTNPVGSLTATTKRQWDCSGKLSASIIGFREEARVVVDSKSRTGVLALVGLVSSARNVFRVMASQVIAGATSISDDDFKYIGFNDRHEFLTWDQAVSSLEAIHTDAMCYRFQCLALCCAQKVLAVTDQQLKTLGVTEDDLCVIRQMRSPIYQAMTANVAAGPS